MISTFEHGEMPELSPTSETADDSVNDQVWNRSPLEQISMWLSEQFAVSEKSGDQISRDAAETIAGLLTPKLAPGSHLGRLAAGQDYDPEILLRECLDLRLRQWNTPNVSTWLARLETWIEMQR